MTGGSAPLLRLSRLTVAFGRRTILHDIALDVSAGEFAVIVGPNGAGKTTLLKAAAGLLPAAGDLMVGGDDVRRIAPAERARRVAYLPQGQEFYWPLAVSDIVGLGRLPRGRRRLALGRRPRGGDRGDGCDRRRRLCRPGGDDALRR